jgi:hypothetical protein
MQIKTFSLDPGLTATEVVFEDGSSWHFLPFEDRQAKLFPLGQKYILALGQSKGIAIFDAERRVQTQLIPDLEHVGLDLSSICFRAECGSLFLQEWLEKPGLEKQGKIALRRVAADGSLDLRIETEIQMHVATLLTRSDGQIVLVGRKEHITFDPETGEFECWPLGEHERIIDYEKLGAYRRSENVFRWFSDDGLYGVRLKLKPEIVFESSWLQRTAIGRAIYNLFDSSRFEVDGESSHPDLPGDGSVHRGLTIEIFRLAPVELLQTVVLRYFPEAAFKHRYLTRYDRETHSGGEPVKKPQGSVGTGEIRLDTPPPLNSRLRDIQWDPETEKFIATVVEAEREVPSNRFKSLERVEDVSLRTVSLYGEVGPLDFITGEPEPAGFAHLPSEQALKALKKLVRERSTQKVDCPTFDAASVAQALNSMTNLIVSSELDDLVFGEQLRFKFRVEGRLIGERNFFERIRKMPAPEMQAILQPLRDLIADYGGKARIRTNNGTFPIMSSPSDQANSALSEAALTLAVLDESGFDALRDWVRSVDQEHDYFAAQKVFPAFVKTTGLNTPQSIRFGIWFFYQQWQSVPYQENWFGLFDKAQEVLSPREFALILVEEMSAFEHFSPEPIETGLDHVKKMLGQDDWSREVIEEAQKLLEKAQD